MIGVGGALMLRIHFTCEDLANTRIAGGPDPVWELSLSSHQLRLRGSNPFLDVWKSRVAGVLHPAGQVREEVGLALDLSPPRGYFPDFLTPFESVAGFDAGLEAVLRTPKKRLRKEIGMLDIADRGRASTIDDLRRGRAGAVGKLGRAMRRYHEVALEPVWDVVKTAVAADRAERIRDLAEGGWGRLLNSLHPAASFSRGVMEVSRWGGSGDKDIFLAGRGILIIPSYFKEQRQLMLLEDTDLPPVLLYPIELSARLAAAPGHEALIALIGRTRTTVLEATLFGETTSVIARRACISLPAASKHLKVLRSAGLVDTGREQYSIRHTITGLGRKLLSGNA